MVHTVPQTRPVTDVHFSWHRPRSPVASRVSIQSHMVSYCSAIKASILILVYVNPETLLSHPHEGSSYKRSDFEGVEKQ